MGDLTENFSKKEFACPCGECQDEDQGMSLDWVNRLQKVRTAYGMPITINSGVRCVAHNKDVGGKDDSEHLDGEGGDIGVEFSHERWNLLPLLMQVFPRIGISKDGFFHLGISKTKAQNVLWIY
jgi:hypothetical protein